MNLHERIFLSFKNYELFNAVCGGLEQHKCVDHALQMHYDYDDDDDDDDDDDYYYYYYESVSVRASGRFFLRHGFRSFLVCCKTFMYLY